MIVATCTPGSHHPRDIYNLKDEFLASLPRAVEFFPVQITIAAKEALGK
jgi:hypothetical protein